MPIMARNRSALHYVLAQGAWNRDITEYGIPTLTIFPCTHTTETDGLAPIFHIFRLATAVSFSTAAAEEKSSTKHL